MNFMLFYILNPEFKMLKPGKMLLETEYEGKTNHMMISIHSTFSANFVTLTFNE